MKKKLWLSLLCILLASLSAVWLLSNYVSRPKETGFRIVSIEDKALLLSDVDIISYNLTSQELVITDQASTRLTQKGQNLYSFTGVELQINGETIYQAVFRAAYMSAIPAPPKISILYPSMIFPSDTENPNAIRLFYPTFEPPKDLSQQNAILTSYFEKANKTSQ